MGPWYKIFVGEVSDFQLSNNKMYVFFVNIDIICQIAALIEKKIIVLFGALFCLHNFFFILNVKKYLVLKLHRNVWRRENKIQVSVQFLEISKAGETSMRSSF